TDGVESGGGLPHHLPCPELATLSALHLSDLPRPHRARHGDRYRPFAALLYPFGSVVGHDGAGTAASASSAACALLRSRALKGGSPGSGPASAMTPWTGSL